MKAWPRAILGMLLVQTATAAVLTGTLAFPLVSAALALLAFLRPLPIVLSRRQIVYGALGLGLVFVTKARLFPGEMPGRFGALAGGYAASYPMAQWLLWVQICLFASRPSARAPAAPLSSAEYAMPLMGAAQMLFATNFITRAPAYRATSLAGACLFAILYAAAAQAATTNLAAVRLRMVRRTVAVAVLTGALLAGVAGSRSVTKNSGQVEMALMRLFQPRLSSARPGLSERTTLSSIRAWRDTHADRVAVRIESESAPGYLRLHARDHFDGRVWESRSAPMPMIAAREPDAAGGEPASDGIVYRLRAGAGPVARRLRVWHAAHDSEWLFVPLDTRAIIARTDSLSMDDHRACRADLLPSHVPYELVAGAEPAYDGPDDGWRQRYLAVPDTLSEEALRVCREAVAHARDTPAIVEAVVGHFQEGYTYGLDIAIPRREDPLSHFLTARPPAHCEYFASAATVMLRLAGVPARYVVGLVALEHNEAGGYWLARHRDAHAWAEAWDDTHGWITVETTPPDGRPRPAPPSAWDARLDQVRFRLSVMWATFREQGLAGLAASLARLPGWLLRSVAGRLFLLAALIWIGVKLGYRARYRRGHGAGASADEKAFRRMLERMDRQARRHGFVRARDETLLRFAARLETDGVADDWTRAAARWYRLCAVLRCDGTPLPETLARLARSTAGT